MHFNAHSPALYGRHATLSPSTPAWINYDEDKMRRVFFSNRAAAKGSELHALAHQLIKNKVRLPDDDKTLNLYVNDAIGYGMSPEVMLFFSENCYGTADCVGYNHPRKKLRVHDLKTGNGPATMKQLLVYAGLFHLEYQFSPHEIETELRLYQNNNIITHTPDPHEIFSVMDRIKTLDSLINALRMGD